jgi:CheY-like chemotaxis protein
MAPRALVLVVEDNPQDRKLLRLLLELERCEVREAGSAEEALSLLGSPAERLPCLLLLDIDLPGISGLELARRLRADARTRALGILAVSSTAGRDAAVRADAAGCDGFLPKPLNVAAFPAAVARWIHPFLTEA